MRSNRLVLASASPRRRDLLASLGLDFDVMDPGVDEAHLPGESPPEYVVRVARDKAMAVASAGYVTLAADTIVVHRGHLLGKPGHPAEAAAMLTRLSGQAHTVVTGLAVVVLDGAPEVHTAAVSTSVRFVELTGEEIAAYVATGEPMDKAGAYALQGRGGMFVESIDGSPSNVVGLPLPATVRLLAAAGIRVLG